MATEHFSCNCPFCAPKKITFDGINMSKRFAVSIIIVMLLLGQSTAASISASPGEEGHSRHDKMAAPRSDIPAQKMKIKASEAVSCGSDNCNCYAIGKCKPCSRFDVGRQLRECLLTGYKQRAYCPHKKEEQFMSCHHIPHPFETRMFWLFEGSAFSLAVLAYAVVYLRQRKMNRMVAMRIQQQINA